MTHTLLKRNSNIINKKYMEYFLPTVLTAMANNIAIMVDSVLVGQLVGSASMAAINLLSPVTQLYFSLTILFGLGASTIISYAKGVNDKKTADKTFTAVIVSLLLFSALLMALQFIFLNDIASVLTSIPKLKQQLILYYVPFIIGTPFSMFLPSIVHCIRSDGRPTFASNLIIISNAINLTMDIVLMGPFKTGIIGSSIATVIGNAVAFVIMLSHFKNPNNTLHFDFSAVRNPRELFKSFCSMFTTGLSGALGTLLIVVRMFFLNSMIQNSAGAEGMVAMSVISSSQIFISAFITGASQTMIPIVSVLLGEKDFAGIKFAFRKAMYILLIASTAIVLVIEMFPEFVARLFGNMTQTEMQVIVPALRISSLSFHGLALSFLIMYYYMATTRKGFSVTISVLNGIALIIPCVYFMDLLWGVNGIWTAMTVAQYGTLLVLAVMLIVTIKKSDGRYKNFYLLDEKSKNEIISVSVSTDFSENTVEEYLSENLTADNETKLSVTSAITHIFSEIKSSGSKKNKAVDIDIRIRYENNSYIILMLSNGNELNSPHLISENNTYKSFECTTVLGMNQIKVII